jgi:hypothetical protein
MANRGYDVVVDVDQEVPFPHRAPEKACVNIYQGDLGHTDLQEDLEFHSSSTPPSSLPPISLLPPSAPVPI